MFIKHLVLGVCSVISLAAMPVLSHSTSHGVEQSAIVIEDARIREFLPAAPSTAAYFELSNHSNEKKQLIKATISGLGRVEIHEHVHTNGMMRMQQVSTVEVGAHKQLAFKPGGYHLMAFEPSEPLKKGQERVLTLYFADKKTVQVPIKVVSLQDKMNKKHNQHSQHSHH
jgi:copper(I)-binding protein